MPKMDTWAWFSWLASIAGHALTALILLQSGKWRQLFPLFGYVTCRTLTSFVLLGITVSIENVSRQCWWYFYVYYFGGIVGSAFSFYIIANIASSFVDSAEMRYVVHTAMRYLGGAVFLGSGLYSFLSPLPFDEQLTRFCVAVDRAGSLAWAITFLIVASLVRRLRLSWSADAKGMALGFALASIGAVAHDWLLGVIDTQILSDVKMGFYLLSLATWIFTLSKRAKPFPARPFCPVTKLNEV